MFTKTATIVCSILFFACAGFAQIQPCATDVRYQQLLKKYPQLAEYEAQIEDQIAGLIAHKTTSAPDTTLYDVPLVIHVIHDYGTENVSDDDLYTAAAYWADVYMERNADTIDVIPPFVRYVGNPRIRLHLATIDPNGKPTKGIDRINSYLANLADDQAKYDQWPQNKYVNIWLVGTFGGSVGAGVVAYAILPSTVAYEPYYDGVICLSSAVNPSTKTVPHEIGHVFNLQHPWGNTNNPAVACGDDHVDDTPPTLGHWNYGCVSSTLYDTTCATGYKKYYMSIDGTVDSLVDYPDTANSQNIMDYTDCQKMFTKGQVARMRAALTSGVAGRNNLWSPANLAATGALAPMPDLPPVADYIMDRTTSGFGNSLDKRTYFLAFNSPGQFVFRNKSWNDTVTSVNWTFSNGATIPTSTNTSFVTNSFAQPGWVTVSLVANSNAGSDTLVNTQAVYAADTTPAGILNYVQDFTSESSVANWPMFNYYNNQFKWEFYNGAGVGDNTCIRYHSYDTSTRLTGIAIGDHDDMFTPAFNLTGSNGTVFLDFFSAGAYTRNRVGAGDPQQQDSLEVDATANGGLLWVKIAGYHLSDLENNGQVNTEFVPTSPSQWVARSVPVPIIDLTPQTYFRFRFWPGNLGNDLYIDKLSISPWPAEVKEALAAAGKFNIYPNPTTGDFSVFFKTGVTGTATITFRDITGKTVLTEQKKLEPESIQKLEYVRSQLPGAGMYFVTITADEENMTQKLVVY